MYHKVEDHYIKLPKKAVYGEGLFFRDDGKLPPKFRKLLEEVKDTPVKSLTLFRKPISVESFLDFITGGEYKKIIKSLGYDNLFHLGIVINNSYILDKQEVLKLEYGNIPSGAETLEVPLGNIEITIGELIENTRKRMGNTNFSRYNARTNNCQNFMMNLLQANGLSNDENTKFIKQDAEAVFNKLPKYAEVLTNLATDTAGIVDNLVHGNGMKKEIILIF